MNFKVSAHVGSRRRDMSQRHEAVTESCVVHTEGTCDRDVLRGHVAATKSQCVHTQENEAGYVAATCPLVCADIFWRVQHEFLQHFVPATCCMQSNELKSVQHVAVTKLRKIVPATCPDPSV